MSTSSNPALTAVAAQKDRAPRVVTLLTTGKLIIDDREALCRVRNMSATGMMIETNAALEVGQELRIGIRCGSEIDARVAWVRDGAAGLALLTTIDVEAALATQPRVSRIVRPRRARAPRLAAECPIEVDARGQLHQGVLLNISQSGARLRLTFRPAHDDRLILYIPGLPMKSAAVRWMRDAEVGVGFYEVLPFSLLAEWSARR